MARQRQVRVLSRPSGAANRKGVDLKVSDRLDNVLQKLEKEAYKTLRRGEKRKVRDKNVIKLIREIQKDLKTLEDHQKDILIEGQIIVDINDAAQSLQRSKAARQARGEWRKSDAEKKYNQSLIKLRKRYNAIRSKIVSEKKDIGILMRRIKQELNYIQSIAINLETEKKSELKEIETILGFINVAEETLSNTRIAGRVRAGYYRNV